MVPCACDASHESASRQALRMASGRGARASERGALDDSALTELGHVLDGREVPKSSRKSGREARSALPHELRMALEL